MKIYYSTKFEREYKKLPIRIKKLAEEKEKIFRISLSDPKLNIHKLKGRISGYWAFWIDQKYRVIFEYAKKDVIWFHLVGDHSIYKLKK